jgi:hypothetical protein
MEGAIFIKSVPRKAKNKMKMSQIPNYPYDLIEAYLKIIPPCPWNTLGLEQSLERGQNCFLLIIIECVK